MSINWDWFVTSTFSTNLLQYRAELDSTIFSLDKAKRLVELKKQHDNIVKRLNFDFQKTWFRQNSSGEAVDLEDMAYAEVVRRMVELMYRKHESRWIDPSLKWLTGNFIRCIEERFTPIEGRASLPQYYADLDDPFATTEKIQAHYPEAIKAQDMQHFLLLCQRRRQKPVPFVPHLARTSNSGSRRIPFGNPKILRVLLTRMLEEPAFFRDLWLPNTLQ